MKFSLKGKKTESKEEVYDSSKPFAPRIPVVNLIPTALVLKYQKLALLKKIELILLGIILLFAALWGANFAFAGIQTVTTGAVTNEINSLQGKVAEVEPYQKYLEGIELTRSNMSKVFAKNIDMGKVMDSIVAAGNTNSITLSNIKITEATTTTEQNTCVNSNPFDNVAQVGCINLSGSANNQAEIIAFFDALGKTEGLTNAFITSMGSGSNTVIFSGSISMTDKIYIQRFGYLTEKIDSILKGGGIGIASANSTATKATATPTATPTPSASKSSTATPGPTATANAAVDTRFGTCKEAIAAGFGPYTKGTDPEYEWYQAEDVTNSGKVCIA